MFSNKKIYLSIGALQPQGVRDMIKQRYVVIAYEPERKAFARYQEIKNDRFMCHNKAVSDHTGTEILYFSGSTGGASTIYWDVNPEEYRDERYEVEVVSLVNVLESFQKVRILHINCEGEEIPIIMGTSLESFKKCQRIFVEFHGHNHYPRLHITDETIQTCVQKLSKDFHVKDCETYHPYYEFLRKD